MVKLLSWDNPEDAMTARAIRGAISVPVDTGTPALVAQHLNDPGFGEALVSSFLLNNTVSTALGDAYHYWSAGMQPEEFDPNFNPRTWIASNVPEETRNDLRGEIMSGLFDDVAGPRALQRKLAGAIYEKNLVRNEAGSWLGSTLGAVAGGIADPLTYLTPEAKVFQTGSTAWRLGGAIMHAASQMAPQEAALWQMQNFRSWRQSLLNVGAGSILGGGVGFFARGLLGDHPINPSNPRNPLASDNVDKQGVVTIVPGEGTDAVPHVDPGAPPLVNSVGAAEAPVIAPEMIGREDQSKLGAGLSKVGDWLTSWTPAGRALQWTSGQARNLITRLLDNTAIYRNTNAFGIASGHSAEDILMDYMSRWHDEPQLSHEVLIRNTQKDLGEIGAPRLDPGDFNSTAYKLLTNTWTPEAAAELTAKYGQQGADRIKAGAEQFTAARQRINANQEAAMRQAGVIRDDAKVEKLTQELKSLREQRNAALEQHDQQTTELKEQGEAAVAAAQRAKAPQLEINGLRRDLREKLTARDAERRQVAAQYDEAPIQKELDHQRGLAPALGKEYGVAQLWEPGMISRTQERFKNFLARHLIDKPDEDWLREAHNLSLGEFQALRTSDPAQYTELLREWAGDEHDFRLRNLQNALEDARQREKLGKLDLNDTLRDLGVLRQGDRQAEVSEYGRYRDKLNADITAETAVRDNLAKEQRAIVEAATAARQQTLDRQLAVGSPEQTAEYIRQAERARQVAQRLTESENRLNDLLDKQLRAESAYNNARDLRARRKDAKRALQEAANDVLAQRELASKNVGQVKRAVRAAGRRAPLDDVIDDITKTLAVSGKLPMSALDAVVSESGRFKARRLVLTPQEKIEAANEGWLRTDLSNLIATQDRQIAGHLGVREALDIGPGRTYQSWEDVQDAVRNDYQRLIDQSTDGRVKGRLENERAAALRDLNGMKGRVLRQIDPGADRDGWLMWASKQMRNYNFIRYAPGMLPSALPDLGSFALQHRVIPMLAQHGREAFGATIDHLEPLLNTEARRMLSASEVAIHGSMLSRTDDGEGFRSGGIGAPGSLKNRITSRVDKIGEGLNHYAAAMSGLGVWDRFWKIASGLSRMDSIRDQVGRYDKLTDLERTHLASLGIGEAEARRLQGFIAQHGETDAASGLWDPHLENWHDTAEGSRAARDFRIAIQRDMNRSRFWPGIGDRPLSMDKWWGRLLLQFQSFGFAFINRYVTPLLQRAVHFHDIQAASSFAALMAMAAVTMTIKDFTRGITPQTRWNIQSPQNAVALGWELLDRSYLFGYLSPYMDSAIKLTGISGATRYEREGLVSHLLGINSALIGDADNFAQTLSALLQGQAKPDKAIDKLTALAPYSSLLRLGAHLYDSVANGTPARDPYRQH